MLCRPGLTYFGMVRKRCQKLSLVRVVVVGELNMHALVNGKRYIQVVFQLQPHNCAQFV